MDRLLKNGGDDMEENKQGSSFTEQRKALYAEIAAKRESIDCVRKQRDADIDALEARIVEVRELAVGEVGRLEAEISSLQRAVKRVQAAASMARAEALLAKADRFAELGEEPSLSQQANDATRQDAGGLEEFLANEERPQE